MCAAIFKLSELYWFWRSELGLLISPQHWCRNPGTFKLWVKVGASNQASLESRATSVGVYGRPNFFVLAKTGMAVAGALAAWCLAGRRSVELWALVRDRGLGGVWHVCGVLCWHTAAAHNTTSWLGPSWRMGMRRTEARTVVPAGQLTNSGVILLVKGGWQEL